MSPMSYALLLRRGRLPRRAPSTHYDFDAATLASLYPTHASYVAVVKKVTEDNLKAGYILKADADATIAEAEKSSIGNK